MDVYLIFPLSVSQMVIRSDDSAIFLPTVLTLRPNKIQQTLFIIDNQLNKVIG